MSTPRYLKEMEMEKRNDICSNQVNYNNNITSFEGLIDILGVLKKRNAH